MWEDLTASLEDCERDPSVRVVVLQGDGRKAFTAGADISEFRERRTGSTATREYENIVDKALIALAAVPCPVVAHIHGVCMGGGLELALACDLRFASRTARFRMPAARLGLGYGSTSIDRLVKIVGPATAAELCFSARTFDGVESERLGLVHQAWDEEVLDERAGAVVATIASNAPLTIRAAKLAIRASTGGERAPTRGEVDQAIAACFSSADYVEGRAAFAEKRSPIFTGK